MGSEMCIRDRPTTGDSLNAVHYIGSNKAFVVRMNAILSAGGVDKDERVLTPTGLWPAPAGVTSDTAPYWVSWNPITDELTTVEGTSWC